MNIHFILNSPAYSRRTIDWLKPLMEESPVFIIISSFNSILWISENKEEKLSFFQVKKRLRQSEIKHVFYHYLSPQMVLLMRDIPADKSTWVVWGADYYDLKKVRKLYLSPESKTYYKKSFVADFINNHFGNSFIQQIDIIASNEEDFVEIKTHLKITAKHITLRSLFPISTYNQIPNKNVNKVLLGNSDDVSNNHIQTIRLLENLEKPYDIIVPLSGITSSYTKKLKALGGRSKHNYEWIDTFISAESFYIKMQDVNIVIFPHLRQQGMGTILPLLRDGRSVYFNKKNPLYRLLVAWGLNVYTLENIGTDIQVLSSELKVQNNEVLEATLDKETIISQWQDVLKNNQ